MELWTVWSCVVSTVLVIVVVNALLGIILLAHYVGELRRAERWWRHVEAELASSGSFLRP